MKYWIGFGLLVVLLTEGSRSTSSWAVAQPPSRLQLDDPFTPRTPLPEATGDRNEPAPDARSPESKAPAFSWRFQRTSEADLLVPEPGDRFRLRFKHGDPSFTDAEIQQYGDLLNAIQEQQFKLRASPTALNSVDQADPLAIQLVERDAINRWESAFYRFARARRQAWLSDNLELTDDIPALPNPFSGSPSGPTRMTIPSNAPATYSLYRDITGNPDDFVGRPVVLYGIYRPEGQVEIPDPGLIRSSNGVVTLLRGKLRSLVDSDLIAMVDTLGYRGPNNQSEILTSWPGEMGTAVPVIVKGWFVKLWGKQPLIVTESVRILTPRPLDRLISEYAPNGTSVREDEEWLYYETLRQLQLTDASSQASLAKAVQQQRIEKLMGELQEKAAADRTLLDQDLKQLRITEDQHTAAVIRLDRQLRSRVARYQKYLSDADAFPLYVDLYNHWNEWRGSLVTLRGHVRRVITSPGDETMFNGDSVHELWLYTDDSQHHPAVIVTPTLPKDFPVGAEVIDRVSVTGCFYKMYVYPAARERKAVPLILAGRVSWNPTDEQVVAHGDAGELSKDSMLYRTALRTTSRNWSDTGVMLFGFASILVMMTIWGRVQRDRRERARLLERVDASRTFSETADDLRVFTVTESTPERYHG